MTPSVSVIIPTIGRETLRRTLESALCQHERPDEVLVVADGPRPDARAAALEFGAAYLETPPTGQWGHEQRNLGMAAAKGDYLSFMDDDDVYLPGAFEAMRRRARESPGRPIIFQMLHRGETLWRRPEIAYRNVSTQMFLFPNVPGRLARWASNPDTPDGRGGDFCFARDTARLWPAGHVLFRKDYIAQLFEHGGLGQAPVA